MIGVGFSAARRYIALAQRAELWEEEGAAGMVFQQSSEGGRDSRHPKNSNGINMRTVPLP